jgi:hypothetical protein
LLDTRAHNVCLVVDYNCGDGADEANDDANGVGGGVGGGGGRGSFAAAVCCTLCVYIDAELVAVMRIPHSSNSDVQLNAHTNAAHAHAHVHAHSRLDTERVFPANAPLVVCQLKNVDVYISDIGKLLCLQSGLLCKMLFLPCVS